MSTPTPNPSAILQTAFSFWSSKVLLTAVEFGLFTKLASRRVTGAELGAELKLHPRGIADFFEQIGAMTPQEQQNLPRVIELGTKYGLEFLPPPK